MLFDAAVPAIMAVDIERLLEIAERARTVAQGTGEEAAAVAVALLGIALICHGEAKAEASPNRGRHTGSGAKQKMMAWRRQHEAHDRITDTGENLRLYDGDWVVVCDRSVGHIGGQEYRGVEAVFMKASGGKIVEYREYLGDIAV